MAMTTFVDLIACCEAHILRWKCGHHSNLGTTCQREAKELQTGVLRSDPQAQGC